jgi:hypothetical protein
MIAALRQVPEKKLLVFDLLNQVPFEGGMLNSDVLAEKQAEVNLAETEAKQYTQQTQQATRALKEIGHRKESDD